MTPPATSVTIHYSEGQSLDQGPSVGNENSPSGPLWRDVFNGGEDILMLTGLERSDGVLINTTAQPLLFGYDETVDATGSGPAAAVGAIPGGMVTAKALVRDAVEAGPMAFQYHGASGQEINNFLPGTLLYENAEHWLTQAMTIWADDSTVPRVVWNQGEADRTLARGEYQTRFATYWSEKVDQIQRITGQATAPVLYLLQTGGYMEKNDNHWMVLDQVDAVRDHSGIMVGPNWHVKVADGVVHPGIEEHIYLYERAAWAIEEIEAGNDWNLLPPESVARVGDTITIPISIRGDETLAVDTGRYVGYGGDPDNLGLEAVGGGSITSASVSGGDIVIGVTGTVTHIRYAHQRAAGIDYADFLDGDGKGYVAHRGLIFTTLTKSVSVGGVDVTLERGPCSFEVEIT